MNAKVLELTKPFDGASLECDGMTRVLHTVLSDHHIPHTPKVGRVELNDKHFSPHFWIELPSGDVVDYRLRMWLGNQAPHGVFSPEKTGVIYEGRTANMPVLTDFLFGVLAGRPRTAGVKEVVDKITKRIRDSDIVKRLTDKVMRYTQTKNPADDLSRDEVALIYRQEDYGDDFDMPGGKELDVGWTDHAEYRSDLRSVDPSKVNETVRDFAEKHPNKHQKVNLMNRGIGKAVVDINTMGDMESAHVVTVIAADGNDTKKEIIERANKVKSAKVKKYVHNGLLRKVDQAGDAAGIWLENLESKFDDLKAEGLMSGFNDADFDDLWYVLTGQKRKTASMLLYSYDLSSRYAYWNNKVFDGKLPHVPIRWSRLKNSTGLIRATLNRATRLIVVNEIVVSNTYKRVDEALDSVLLHEMCHCYVLHVLQLNDNHGSTFRQTMHMAEGKSGIKIQVTEAVPDDVADEVNVPEYVVVMVDKGDRVLMQLIGMKGYFASNAFDHISSLYSRSECVAVATKDKKLYFSYTVQRKYGSGWYTINRSTMEEIVRGGRVLEHKEPQAAMVASSEAASDILLFPGQGDGNDDGDKTHHYLLGKRTDGVVRNMVAGKIFWHGSDNSDITQFRIDDTRFSLLGAGVYLYRNKQSTRQYGQYSYKVAVNGLKIAPMNYALTDAGRTTLRRSLGIDEGANAGDAEFGGEWSPIWWATDGWMEYRKDRKTTATMISQTMKLEGWDGMLVDYPNGGEVCVVWKGYERLRPQLGDDHSLTGADRIARNTVKTFGQISSEGGKGHRHHWRKTCVECGGVETCRCSAPKVAVTGLCFDCCQKAGIDFQTGEKLEG